MGSTTLVGTAPITVEPRASAQVRDGRTPLASTAAFAGIAALTLLAPFEQTAPLLTLPGQSISNLEALLFGSFAVFAASMIWSRRVPAWRTPLTVPALAFLAASSIAAAVAPVARTNAVHMAMRLGVAFGVYALTVSGITSRVRLATVAAIAIVAGALVSVLAILEFFKVPAVLLWLKAYRPFLVSVGALVRAGGPLQYPTIASMFLEVVFAIGIGLMLMAADASRRAIAAVLFIVLCVIAYGVTLTFTRSGLITMAASLAIVGALRIRSRGVDNGAALVALLAASVLGVFFASRSAQAIWLRFTTEGQETWYRATIAAPADLTLGAGVTTQVPVTLTNAGRLVWSSADESPFYLSYHWLVVDEDRVVNFEGIRTPFPWPVAPSQSVTLLAKVRGPRHPGRYRLTWDVVQEHRLWFSREPGAIAAVTLATVAGESVLEPMRTTPPPKAAVRPGRLVLWRAAARMIAAHPLLGVGPDNFRLLYAGYADLPAADTRMHSNNMYIEVLAGGGLVAGLAFAWLLWTVATLLAAIIGSNRADTIALASGVIAGIVAIALHGLLDSFLEFAPTYILFAVTLGLAAVCARGVESGSDAHRV